MFDTIPGFKYQMFQIRVIAIELQQKYKNHLPGSLVQDVIYESCCATRRLCINSIFRLLHNFTASIRALGNWPISTRLKSEKKIIYVQRVRKESQISTLKIDIFFLSKEDFLSTQNKGFLTSIWYELRMNKI